VKRGGSLSFLVGTISNVLVMEIGGQMWGAGGISYFFLFYYSTAVNIGPGTAKVKIVKKERDPPLFTRKQLIKFKKILRNTTQVIV
jgi:hypothetical protein